jgi:hypothetical protein
VSPGPVDGLGLIVVGDYALATGEDRHVAFAASLLAESAHCLAWVWMIPADRVQIAAALAEAWLRPQPVACFGGLGNGVDDHVLASVAALQLGRDQVGLPQHHTLQIAGCTQVANVAFFHGAPSQSHELFAGWWRGVLDATAAEGALASERVAWRMPESDAAALARQSIKTKFPLVAQRIIAAPGGGVSLRLTASSRGKAQAARKALQAELARG